MLAYSCGCRIMGKYDSDSKNPCESLLKSETSNLVTLLVGFHVMVDENKCWVDAKTFLLVDTYQ